MQAEKVEKAKRALMELQINSLFELLSNIGTVYRSRMKVDAYDSVKSYSELVQKQYL